MKRSLSRDIGLAGDTQSLPSLELGNLALPIILRFIPQHILRFLDTDQASPRVVRVRLVWDVGEYFCRQFRSWRPVRAITVRDVEHVLALERLFKTKSKGLGTISRIDIAKATD